MFYFYICIGLYICVDVKYFKWIGCFIFDYYGKDCNQLCLDYCNNNCCYIYIGNCFDCKDGYQG